jgi:ABC-type antimicrobial peptide transport system permease subunit
MHGWLQTYYYRITIGPGVFIASATAAVGVTIITISVQAIKAALMNPVESLRSE